MVTLPTTSVQTNSIVQLELLLQFFVWMDSTASNQYLAFKMYLHHVKQAIIVLLVLDMSVKLVTFVYQVLLHQPQLMVPPVLNVSLVTIVNRMSKLSKNAV